MLKEHLVQKVQRERQDIMRKNSLVLNLKLKYPKGDIAKIHRVP